MEFDATVLLPDHLHAIWTLPAGDTDYSKRWAWVKKEFTKRWLESGRPEQAVTAGRSRDGRRGVWQPKFWEHTIRDAKDLERHVEYIHYNPVKHGLVRCPHAWPWSSLSRWVGANLYPVDWACSCVCTSATMDFSDLEAGSGNERPAQPALHCKVKARVKWYGRAVRAVSLITHGGRAVGE